jgi:ABC-type lipoprotein export system ATPase subunit
MSDSELDEYRRHQVGFVWQQVARNLIPYLTARENVELPMTISGLRWKERRGWADELLEMVGLADRRHHKLAQLSGGEQQRVAIAVALANRPILLLADEPTGEVDSATARGIYETFKRLNSSYGLTTIIVTHDPQIAEFVDRIVAIRDGKTSTEIKEERGEYEEYVVLDSAGRLQVPKEYLERFGIKDRAKLEVADEGILIRPVEGRGRVELR